MSEQESPTGENPGAPKLKMMFRVETWSIKSRVNRSGREEGDTISVIGHLFAPTIDPNTPLTKATGQIKPKEAQDRMSIKIGKDNSVLSLPLEEFAMERITTRFKEMAGDYGLVVSIEFEANETTDRQPVEYVDFSFSKLSPAAKKPAVSAVQQPQQKDNAGPQNVSQSPPLQAAR